MSKEDNGGSAFPCQPTNMGGSPNNDFQYGLSIRDWFAGMALTGIMKYVNPDDGLDDHRKGISHLAYKIADDMLEERED